MEYLNTYAVYYHGKFQGYIQARLKVEAIKRAEAIIARATGHPINRNYLHIVASPVNWSATKYKMEE